MAEASDAFAALQQLFQANQSSFGLLANHPPVTLPSGPALTELSEKTAAIAREWTARHTELWQGMLNSSSAASPLADTPGVDMSDRRFSGKAWSQSVIYDYWRRAYLLNSHYIKKLSDELPIADKPARDRLDFALRQYVDAMSPANFAATNPEFIEKAIATKGASIQHAMQNLIRDVEQGAITTTDKTAFVVGRNLATTSGKVVFQNELFQLLQYAPLSDKVFERPLLIVPPCINKYYILDLQPHNSFVRHSVEQGNTVFVVSWRNPGPEQGRLGWDDYIEDGLLTAISTARDIAKTEQINALGFCVGGTLLTTALAVAAARGENPVASLTLLTTILDYSEPGDLGCFIDENTIAAKEHTIGKNGVFSGREMAGVFSALRANDMIWQYVVNSYLKGEPPTAFDLLYWNADSTNLPGPFLVWYLRHLYQENALRIPDALQVCGAGVDLGRVDIPVFALATREDHIVPWRSAFRSAMLLGGDVMFVLGASGHVAGVINPARANKRSYSTGAPIGDDADTWLAAAADHPGSWWTAWSQWLAPHAGKVIAARKRLGNARYKPIEDAPGTYVLEKLQ